MAGFLLLLRMKNVYMIGFIKEYKRKKLLASVQRVQHPVLLNFKDVHVLGILFVANSQNAMAEAVELFEALGNLNVRFSGAVVECGKCFRNHAARNEYIEFCNSHNVDFISKGAVNWVGQPHDKAAPQLDGKRFNLFLVMNLGNSFTVDYLTQKVEADCIVGMHNNRRMPYTLVMEPAAGDFSYSRYLEGVFDFLKKVNA